MAIATKILNQLADIKAMIHGGDGIVQLSTNTVVRKWENINADLVEDCVDYLRRYTSALNESTESRSVTDLVIDKTSLEGLWRVGKVSQKREDNGKYTIFQELQEGFVQSLTTDYLFQITNVDGSPDLDGLRFYDSGLTNNSEIVYYGENGVYAYWNDSTLGWIVTAIADVGNASVTDYFVLQDYPDTITVSGAGDTDYNGVYPFVRFTEDSPRYELGDVRVHSLGQGWGMYTSVGPTSGYGNDLNTYLPPETGWIVDSEGVEPAPTLTHTLPTTQYIGAGTYSGTLTLAAIAVTVFDFSEFLIDDGHIWHSGAKTTVLKLPNVDPAKEEDIRYELQGETYFTDPAIKYETIEGDNYYIDARPVMEIDGSMSILLFLSDQQNTDLYFHYQASNTQISGHYYKWDTTETLLDALVDDALFDIYGKHSDEYTDTTDTQKIPVVGAVWHQTATGIYYEAILTDASLQDLTSTTYFRANTLSTMQDEVIGRTVTQRRLTRGEDDHLFDLNIDLDWVTGESEALESNRTTIFTGININPESTDSICIDADDNLYTWTTFKTFLADYSGSFRISENDDGTINYDINAYLDNDGSLEVTVAENLSSEVTKKLQFGLTQTATDAITPPADTQGQTYRMAKLQRGDGKFDVEEDTAVAKSQTSSSEDYGTYDVTTSVDVFLNQTALPLAAALLPSFDTTYGTWAIKKSLNSPSGTGNYTHNEDGTYSYSIVTRTVKITEKAGVLGVADGTDWQIFALGMSPERNQTRQTVSYQQIRRRIGGELSFNEDPDTGDYIGVRWDNAFDLDHDGRIDEVAPAAWESNGYQRRYGEWNSDWNKKSYANYLTRNPDSTDLSTRNPYFGSNNTGVSDDPIYIGTGGEVFIAALPDALQNVTDFEVGDVWYSVADDSWYRCKLLSTSFFLLTNTTYFTAYASDPGWQFPGVISRRGAGTWPIENTENYIAILQELEREVLWDNDFDLTWFYGNTTVTPTAWASNGYDVIYGDWNEAGWEKNFIQNYLTRNQGGNTNPAIGSNGSLADAPLYIGTSGHVFIAVLTSAASTVTSYKANDVWFAAGNFYRATADGTGPTALSSLTTVTPANVYSTCPGLPGYIAQRGVDTYPAEELAAVGVIDESGGYAFDSSARVSFYTNPSENPRMTEIWEAVKRYALKIELYTYFAVNPHWLAEANRRIPSDWVDFTEISESVSDYVSTSTSVGKVQVPTGFAINAGDSNFDVDHSMTPISGDVWAFKKKIILMTEWEADTEALNAIVAQLQNTDNGGVYGVKAKVMHDLSDVGTTPWSGTYKDAG